MGRKWFKSSRCSGGSCVEVAGVDSEILVRDSKNPGQEPLRFSAEEWTDFVEGVNRGEFGVDELTA